MLSSIKFNFLNFLFSPIESRRFTCYYNVPTIKERQVSKMLKIEQPFKDRLEQALAMRDMKPVDLARKTGIAPSTISQYRSGYSKPKDHRLVLIANALNVDPTWLMGIDVPIETESIDLSRLSESQYKRLKSYYDFLVSEKSDEQ